MRKGKMILRSFSGRLKRITMIMDVILQVPAVQITVSMRQTVVDHHANGEEALVPTSTNCQKILFQRRHIGMLFPTQMDNPIEYMRALSAKTLTCKYVILTAIRQLMIIAQMFRSALHAALPQMCVIMEHQAPT